MTQYGSVDFEISADLLEAQHHSIDWKPFEHQHSKESD